MTRSGWGNSRSTTWVHSAVSRSSFTGAVEAIDEGIHVATSIQVQCAHDAGHAQHVHLHPAAKPATAVANQRKVFRRENAGPQPCQIAFHQCIHSDIGPALCCS